MTTPFEYWRINATLVSEDQVEEISSPYGVTRKPQTQKRPAQKTLWRVERELGRGTFGRVRLERNTSSGKTRAVKRIALGHDEYEKELLALVEFSKARYRHAAVFVDFLGWFGEGPHIYFAMEYLALGDLEVNVKARSGTLPISEAREITSQILTGLEIMHEENFIHRDLKPKNVLVVASSPWHVKLADFGSSKRLSESVAFDTRCGTPLFQAPELRFDYFEDDNESNEMTSAVDIWAAGCIVYRLITGVLPFPADSSSLKSYCKGTSELPQNLLLDDESASFVRLLLSPRYQDRPLAFMALRHQWFGSNESERGLDMSTPHAQHQKSPINSDAGSISEMNYNTMTHLGLRSSKSHPWADQSMHSEEEDATVKLQGQESVTLKSINPNQSNRKFLSTAGRSHQNYRAPFVEDENVTIERPRLDRPSSSFMKPTIQSSQTPPSQSPGPDVKYRSTRQRKQRKSENLFPRPYDTPPNGASEAEIHRSRPMNPEQRLSDPPIVLPPKLSPQQSLQFEDDSNEPDGGSQSSVSELEERVHSAYELELLKKELRTQVHDDDGRNNRPHRGDDVPQRRRERTENVARLPYSQRPPSPHSPRYYDEENRYPIKPYGTEQRIGDAQSNAFHRNSSIRREDPHRDSYGRDSFPYGGSSTSAQVTGLPTRPPTWIAHRNDSDRAQYSESEESVKSHSPPNRDPRESDPSPILRKNQQPYLKKTHTKAANSSNRIASEGRNDSKQINSEKGGKRQYLRRAETYIASLLQGKAETQTRPSNKREFKPSRRTSSRSSSVDGLHPLDTDRYGYGDISPPISPGMDRTGREPIILERRPRLARSPLARSPERSRSDMEGTRPTIPERPPRLARSSERSRPRRRHKDFEDYSTEDSTSYEDDWDFDHDIDRLKNHRISLKQGRRPTASEMEKRKITVWPGLWDLEEKQKNGKFESRRSMNMGPERDGRVSHDGY